MAAQAVEAAVKEFVGIVCFHLIGFGFPAADALSMALIQSSLFDFVNRKMHFIFGCPAKH